MNEHSLYHAFQVWRIELYQALAQHTLTADELHALFGDVAQALERIQAEELERVQAKRQADEE